jgi:hypothetical protein
MNISVIIPVHEHNEQIANLLEKAIESIVKQESEIKPKVIFVCPPSILDDINQQSMMAINKGLQCLVVTNNGDTDYQSQVNLGVDSVITDYFSVLEFDDEYGTTYFKNATKYVESYPEIDVFLTMMIEVNEKNEGIKLTNETVWAQQFVGENGEIGYLSANALKQYTDFKLSGAIIKKSEFINLGRYKVNIKLTFMLEFLLRALNNANKIFSIPKIGYKHLATRENSLFGEYQKNMSIDERKFWFDVANKEANFTNDRAIDTSKLQKIVVA